jgi:hypothetical protein
MANININLDSLNPSSFKKTVRHKVQDGDNIYRILPPFGPEANGYPYRKWNVIWGLTDPNSGRERPYASSSTYEGRCPVYDYLDALKQKVQGLEGVASEDKIKQLNDFISRIRPKSTYSYNASNQSGQVGVLELKTTAHKKVIALMDKYIKDYNQDPTSLNSAPNDSGVWFNITRTGRGFDTTYDAFKNQTTVKDENGVPSFKDDRSPLAENIVQDFDSLAYDLNSLYEKKTYEELKDILVANLLTVANDLPEVLVEGFGLDENDVQSVPGGVVAQPAINNDAPAVNLNLGTQPDVAVSTAAPSTNTTDDDILKMADDIFNS